MSGSTGAVTSVQRTRCVFSVRSMVTPFLSAMLKGFLAVRIALWLAHFDPSTSYLIGILAALFVVIGHSFPVWLRFRGGKGVAAAAGACLGLLPMATFI